MKLFLAILASIPLVWGEIDCGDAKLDSLKTCLDDAFSGCGADPSVRPQIDQAKMAKMRAFGQCMMESGADQMRKNGPPPLPFGGGNNQRRKRQPGGGRGRPRCHPGMVLGEHCGLPRPDFGDDQGGNGGPPPGGPPQGGPPNGPPGGGHGPPPFLRDCMEEVKAAVSSGPESTGECVMHRTHDCIDQNSESINEVLGCDFGPPPASDASCPEEMVSIIQKCAQA